MKRKKRAYSSHFVKANYSYSVEQVADLCRVSIATVRRWIKNDGLIRIPKTRPYLVHSTALKAFLLKRKKEKTQPCEQNEAYCMGCSHPRNPILGTGTIKALINGTYRFQATCSYCNRKMFKVIGRWKWSEKHPLAAYLQDASKPHNGEHSQPPKCSLGKDGDQQ